MGTVQSVLNSSVVALIAVGLFGGFIYMTVEGQPVDETYLAFMAAAGAAVGIARGGPALIDAVRNPVVVPPDTKVLRDELLPDILDNIRKEIAAERMEAAKREPNHTPQPGVETNRYPAPLSPTIAEIRERIARREDEILGRNRTPDADDDPSAYVGRLVPLGPEDGRQRKR